MPRQRGGARPAPRPAARPAAPMQQQRSASTAAMPARAAPPPAPAAAAPPAAAPVSQGPGLFANMASTAAGVAVGSTIGHTLGAGITSMFGGSSAAPEPVAAAPAEQSNNWAAQSCDADAKNFTKCLDDNQGNMQICSWYLEQLKACQSMAKQY